VQDLPPNTPLRAGSLTSILFFLAWIVLLAAWTVGLLSAGAPGLISSLLPPGTSFYVSKTTHVAAYAFLAALVCWLSPRWAGRVALWLALLGHGALTEYLQQFVPGRTGQLADVGLDALGVLLGLSAGLALRRLRGRA
jgi:VanZ family protein